MARLRDGEHYQLWAMAGREQTTADLPPRIQTDAEAIEHARERLEDADALVLRVIGSSGREVRQVLRNERYDRGTRSAANQD